MLNNKPLKEYSNEELAAAMRELNLTVGPITSTTRKVYENRLRSYLKENDLIKVEENVDKSIKFDDKNDDHREKKEELKDSNSICKDNTKNENTTFGSCNGHSDSVQSSEKIDNGLSQNNKKRENGTNEVAKNEIINNYKNSLYYGVWVPYIHSKVTSNHQQPLVFQSQNDALKTMKNYRGSRFKSFSSKVDAEAFSLSQVLVPQLSVDKICEYVANHVDQQQNNNNNDGNNKTVLKSPSFQELMKFRRAIEENDMYTVKTCITNPRYLVSSCDIPVVLQEGSRLNAIHVSIKYNKIEILDCILRTLRNNDFLKLIYPDASSENIEFRKNHLLDLYLNTPEKILFDTPLHLACKFGFVDIVRYLLDFEEINISALNKDGKCSRKVVCQRVNTKPEIKVKLLKQINRLLEEKAYIPLLDTDDGSKVGRPVISLSPKALRNSTHKVKAFAGPIPVEKADMIYEKWKKSPKTNKHHAEILKIDYDKGLERVGRIISSDEKIPFTEYWSFLDCYTNLTTQTGIGKLECYLRNKSLLQNKKRTRKRQSFSAPKMKINQESCMEDIKRKLSFTDDLSPEKKANDSEFKHNYIGPKLTNNSDGEKVKDKNFAMQVENPMKYPTKLCECNRQLEYCDNCSIDIDLINLTASFRSCSISKSNRSEFSTISENYESNVDNVSKQCNSSAEIKKLNETDENTSKCQSEPKQSTEHLYRDFDSLLSDQPDDYVENDVFIYGDYPSKQDVDVYRAMGTSICEQATFPYVYRWRQYLSSFSWDTISSWPSPCSPRYKKIIDRKKLLWTA